MRFFLSVCAGLLALSTPALAGFESWSVESEDDPFSGGNRTTVSYSSSTRSGVIIFCDTAKQGLTVRAVPGFAFEDSLNDITPELEFAIDGKRLVGQSGTVGTVADNLAVSETALSVGNSETFVVAFVRAEKQVAIKDGISDRPHLLKARGSTKAGAALVRCMAGQKG